MVTDKKAKEAPKATDGFISVESFLSSAAEAYHMSNIQVYAFKTMMKSQGKGVVSGMNTYIPYLEKYLGKRGKN